MSSEHKGYENEIYCLDQALDVAGVDEMDRWSPTLIYRALVRLRDAQGVILRGYDYDSMPAAQAAMPESVL
jgi:hypothetical protein